MRLQTQVTMTMRELDRLKALRDPDREVCLGDAAGMAFRRNKQQVL